jgi:hypothetical protein
MNKGPCSWKNIPKSLCYVTFGIEIFQWQGSNTLEVLEYLDAQKYKARTCKEYFFMCKIHDPMVIILSWWPKTKFCIDCL